MTFQKLSLKNSVLVTLFAGLSIIACEKEKAKAPDSNEPPLTEICDSVNFTYTANIETIIKGNCAFVGCHGGGSQSGGVNLEGYTAVAIEAKKPQLLSAIKHESGFSRMPQGRPKLSDSDIQAIECWIKQNTPQ